ncbi:DUF1566 domain-containing protein [Candidatus Magnetobacterium casense]|uniref:DUF1566 domain-containing protein n=1 Tax=Candidatus Magnetobacterium casense TaxID=1455061 RepID=A0ABS6RXW3_9BACT|nr:DUF1566 domain-containing protein [Candidatus Magnetobacterium casensis]MBV6341461.1 DUF1566 domain-containing protein [Candidatus Magnetobacterium casensis]
MKPDETEYQPAPQQAIDSNGTFSITYKSETTKAPGIYKWWAEDGQTGAISNTVSYTITPTPGGKRFTDNGDGSMTDTKTGLQWMKNSGGGCYATWNQANTCVPSGWRLPTIDELYTLCREDGTTTGLDLNATNWYYCNGHAVDRYSQLRDDGFDVQSGDYWSSTSYAGSTSHAWIVGMDDGNVYANGKSYVLDYVWPVRSGH